MTQLTQGALVIVGLNTAATQVFWNGAPVQGVVEVKVTWTAAKQKIKLTVNVANATLYEQLVSAGIVVKTGAEL
jgi:hypothetical protein